MDTRRETREVLLNAASKLFADNGFEGTTVEAIAKVAKVNVSLISYHFNGKEGLYRTCLDRFGKVRIQDTQTLLQSVQSKEELRIRLDMFIENLLVVHMEQPDLTRMILNECSQQLTLAKDIFKDSFLKSFEMLVDFLEEAKDNGFIRADSDPFSVAACIFGSVVHLCQHDNICLRFFNKTLNDKKYRTTLKTQLLQMVVRGIFNEE